MSEQKKGFFGRLKERLGKTRGTLVSNIQQVFSGKSKIDDEVFEELEEILIQADIGVETTVSIVEDMRRISKEQRLQTPDELYDLLKKELIQTLSPGDHIPHWEAPNGGTHITMVAGVNGTGKTTTIGKLASHLKAQGKSVMLGAADTFRAAAVEQLSVWAERSDVPIIKHQEGADPASVAFDAADAAQARGADCLIIDTAGRLHTKVNLMEELRKIQRVIDKKVPGAPHQVLLVLDATTGQNGLQQALQFTEALKVTGIVITKLDGTAKGGIAIAIQKQLGIPIKYIGVGEAVDDLQPFDPQQFVEALFS